MTSSQSSSTDHDAPSLLRRVPLAFGAFFALLGDAGLAARFALLRRAGAERASPEPGTRTVAPEPAAPAPANAPLAEPSESPRLKDASPDSALQLLALLQRDARLIDFAREDLAGYSDAQIGAAARLVHEGCAKVLREHFSIVPVRDEAEGSRITLPSGFDATTVRVTGNVVGEPPFTGSLSHRGWRVSEVRLPRLAERHDARVIVPAEVEL